MHLGRAKRAINRHGARHHLANSRLLTHDPAQAVYSCETLFVIHLKITFESYRLKQAPRYSARKTQNVTPFFELQPGKQARNLKPALESRAKVTQLPKITKSLPFTRTSTPLAAPRSWPFW